MIDHVIIMITTGHIRVDVEWTPSTVEGGAR